MCCLHRDEWGMNGLLVATVVCLLPGRTLADHCAGEWSTPQRSFGLRRRARTVARHLIAAHHAGNLSPACRRKQFEDADQHTRCSEACSPRNLAQRDDFVTVVLAVVGRAIDRIGFPQTGGRCAEVVSRR